MNNISKIIIVLGLSFIVFFNEVIEEIIFAIKDKRILFLLFVVVLIPTGILIHKMATKIDRHFLIGKCYNCNKNLLSYNKVLKNLECLNCKKLNQTNYLYILGNFILLFISIIFWRDYIFPNFSILKEYLTFSIFPAGILFFYLSSKIIHLKQKSVNQS